MENNKKNKFNLKNLKKNTCNSLFEIEYLFNILIMYFYYFIFGQKYFLLIHHFNMPFPKTFNSTL